MRTADCLHLREKVLHIAIPKSNLKFLTTSLYQSSHKKIGIIPSKGESSYPDLPQITITSNGVTKLLSNLKPHKASGPDSISARLLKEIAHQLAPVLNLLFQNSIDQGTLPDDWKHTIINLIFKKGERSKASNYRPISLTSIVCKSVEYILHSNIISHLAFSMRLL